MDLGDITTATRNRLNELDVDNSHWSDDGTDDKPGIHTFINEGLRDIPTRVPLDSLPDLWDYEEQHLTVSKGNYYDLPDQWVGTRKVFLYGKPALIRTIDDETAIEYNSLYLPSQDYPIAIVPYQQGKMKIYPAATQTYVNGLKHNFVRMPALLTEDSDIPELPPSMHQWLVDYAVWRALSEDDMPQAEKAWSTYISHFGSS